MLMPYQAYWPQDVLFTATDEDASLLIYATQWKVSGWQADRQNAGSKLTPCRCEQDHRGTKAATSQGANVNLLSLLYAIQV